MEDIAAVKDYILPGFVPLHFWMKFKVISVFYQKWRSHLHLKPRNIRMPNIIDTETILSIVSLTKEITNSSDLVSAYPSLNETYTISLVFRKYRNDQQLQSFGARPKNVINIALIFVQVLRSKKEIMNTLSSSWLRSMPIFGLVFAPAALDELSNYSHCLP